MNNITERQKKVLKKWQQIVCVCCIPLVIAIAYLCFNMAEYVVLDDIYLHNIAASVATNKHSEFLVCSNVLLGYLFKGLYSIIPTINWYSVSQIGFLYVIICSLLFLSSRYPLKYISYTFFYIVECFVLARMTFTSLAFLGMITGIVWYLENVKQFKKQSIIHICYVLLLFLISLSIRGGNVYLFSLGFIIVMSILCIKNNRKAVAKVLVLLLVLLFANYSLVTVGRIYKASIPESMYYTQFQAYRGSAYDGGKIDYELNQKYFENNGVSKNDIELFQSAMFADKNVFTDGFEKIIVNSRSFNDRFNTDILGIMRDIFLGEAKIQNFTVFFLLYAFVVFILLKGKRFDIGILTVVTAAAIGYLHFRRRGLTRVTNMVAIIGMLLITFVLIQNAEQLKVIKLRKCICNNSQFRRVIAVILSVCVVTGYSALLFRQVRLESPDYSQIIEDVRNDSSSLYVSDSWSGNRLHNHKLSVFESDFDRLPVALPFGTWYIYSYYWYDYFDTCEIGEYSTSAFNLLLNDNVKYITDTVEPDSVVRYFQEHYHKSVSYTEVKEYKDSGFKVYSFEVNSNMEN